MNLHAELLKLLLPPVAYERNGSALSILFAAEASVLDLFEDDLVALIREIDPRTASYLLQDWERIYGLPDECQQAADTIVDRRLRLGAKVAETGGISRDYFLALAKALGYQDVSITSFKPMTCEDSCEGQLLSEMDRFAWRVNMSSQQKVYRQITAESSCEDPIDAYKQGPLECLLTKLQPADGDLLFNYEEI